MLHFIGDLLSPAGARGKLGILIYHRVLAAPDLLLNEDIDAATFAMHMRSLAAECNVLQLGDACKRLANGTLPARAVCVTFDDGYADNESVALPILKRYGVPATFFIAPGYSNGSVMFNDAVIEAVRVAPKGTHDLSRLGLGKHDLSDSASRRATIGALLGLLKYRPVRERGELASRLAAALGMTPPAADLMMKPGQIKRLQDEGMEIGAHTVNHPILAVLGEREARAEIFDSKRLLEEITGTPVTLFAYPNGLPGRDYGPRDVQLVKEAGFAAAVSTVDGVAGHGSDSFQLPRVGLWDRTMLRLRVRLLVHFMRPVAAGEQRA
jgi:peptidoglycan/xylan/chitin deacetylase (PgdA/CDA1 family)